jgi:hypothetical protein
MSSALNEGPTFCFSKVLCIPTPGSSVSKGECPLDGRRKRAAMIRTRTRVPRTGCFASRRDLTAHVWAISRQQLFPNRRSIAEACGISLESVDEILRSKEGLQDYLTHGCLSGGPARAT